MEAVIISPSLFFKKKLGETGFVATRSKISSSDPFIYHSPDVSLFYME